MQGLTIQVFDPNEVFCPKVSAGCQAATRQKATKESSAFERLLEKASRGQEAPDEIRRPEGKTTSRRTEARTGEVGREDRGARRTRREGSNLGGPELRGEGGGGQGAPSEAPIVSGSTDSEEKTETVRDVKIQYDNFGNRGDKSETVLKIHANETGGDLRFRVVGFSKDLLAEILAVLKGRLQTFVSVSTEGNVATDLAEAAAPELECDGTETSPDPVLLVEIKGQPDAPELAKQLEALLAPLGSFPVSVERHDAVVEAYCVAMPWAQTPAPEEASSLELPAPKGWSPLMVQVKGPDTESGLPAQKAPQVQTSFAAPLSEDFLLQPDAQRNEQIDVSLPVNLRITPASETVLTYKGKESALAKEHVADFGSSTSFAEHGAPTQASATSGSPTPEGARATSFSTIVADRIAAIAEQVAMRGKQADFLLRLQTEEGASVLVNLREQAGKVLVNVRSGDERILTLLQSQKETIVRHLEEKQVAATISVSPIGEEDLPRRESREQPRRQWPRQGKAFNPYVDVLA